MAKSIWLNIELNYQILINWIYLHWLAWAYLINKSWCNKLFHNPLEKNDYNCRGYTESQNYVISKNYTCTPVSIVEQAMKNDGHAILIIKPSQVVIQVQNSRIGTEGQWSTNRTPFPRLAQIEYWFLGNRFDKVHKYQLCL